MHRNLAVRLVHDRETQSTSSQVNEHDGDSLVPDYHCFSWVYLPHQIWFCFSKSIFLAMPMLWCPSYMGNRKWIWRKKFKGCESEHLHSTCQMPSNMPGGLQNVSNPLILTSSTASPALSRWEDWCSKRFSWLLKMRGWNRVYILQGYMMPKLSIRLFKKTV